MECTTLSFECLETIFFLLDNFSLNESIITSDLLTKIISKTFEIIYYVFKSSFYKDKDSNLKMLKIEYSKKKIKSLLINNF